ncbi:GTPase RsgA, partial [Pararhodobacter sp. SW119]|uniref:GTPase RsgA n=1 Tax=Pararhodobacter sp. SW119 TaxID=2780075 RepID=UPI001FD7F7CD
MFIVTSCNEDFNLARLERYLVLVNEAGINAVILLTKVDQVDDAEFYRAQAGVLQRDLPVVALNATAPDAADRLSPWCGPGQTVALTGSSGVGKSTLLNNLAGKAPAEAQLIGSIRKGDAKGRHTTTARTLHAIAGGVCVIDTPGMRSLHVSDAGAGLDMLFAEITELAPK